MPKLKLNLKLKYYVILLSTKLAKTIFKVWSFPLCKMEKLLVTAQVIEITVMHFWETKCYVPWFSDLIGRNSLNQLTYINVHKNEVLNQWLRT